jgi:acetyltransferase-like isoleucine patch superfamily enzyme
VIRWVWGAPAVAWRQLSCWRRAWWQACAESIAHERIRSRILSRHFGWRARNITFGRSLRISHPHSVRCGEHVLLNDRLHVAGSGGCTIGSYTYFAPDVTLLTTTHDATDMRELTGPIAIGELCWIGAGAIVLPGVQIGRGAVVGAGSVVTHDVAPEVVVAGNPARVIKPRALRYPYRLPGGRYYLAVDGRVIPADAALAAVDAASREDVRAS